MDRRDVAVLLFVALWALFALCLPARGDWGSDVHELVSELRGIRRALESGKCGGR